MNGRKAFLNADAPRNAEKDCMNFYKKLPLIFALIGFFIGALLSAQTLYLEWSGHQVGPVLSVIGSIVFPIVWLMIDFEGGKTFEVLSALAGSAMNGCLYAAISFLIARTVKAWRASHRQPI
jgi:hypothetical protein